MRISNKALINTDAAPLVVVASYASKAVWLGHISDFAIQLAFTASSCTFKLQGSCDEGDSNGQSQTEYEAKITNWSDISASAVPSTGAGNIMYNMQSAGYNWVRVVITGSATITSARFNVKGI